jgi:starch-binding outer membrane protein, SusD/RagB family
MKKIAIILTIIGALWTYSCNEDWLTVPPYGLYTTSNLVSKESVDKLLMGCYSAITGESDWHGDLFASPTQLVLGNIHGGEALKGGPSRTDLGQWQEYSEFAITVGNSMLLDYWLWAWDAIDRCNLVIKQLALVAELTDAQKTQVTAEARFLRAHYYFYLKRVFYNIPWVDETTTDLRVPNTVDNNGTTYVDVWPQIAEDMDFARKNLPATQADWGRPNKWAADAYYAKIQIYRANFGNLTSAAYTEALTILNDIIANGVNQHNVKYGLMDYYYDNFSGATENNKEAVFAMQLTVNDGVATTARVFGKSPRGNPEGKIFGTQIANGPGWGNGWGFYYPSQWYVDHFRTNMKGLPYLDMYTTNPNSVKSDFGLSSIDPFTPDTAGLDPRLDFSVGRRGIPYLDFGIMPGKTWLRGTHDIGGPYLQKKWAVKNSEAGIYTPDKINLESSVNVCIIRFADVLLWAAECEARVGSLTNARSLVNQIRNRMKQNATSVRNRVKLDDGVTDAANYRIDLYPSDGSADDAFTSIPKALDAILYERTLELGLEGHRYFDVIRFGKDEVEFPAYINKMKVTLAWFAPTAYTPVPDKWSPIPTTAIANSQKEGKATLTQNPGY